MSSPYWWFVDLLFLDPNHRVVEQHLWMGEWVNPNKIKALCGKDFCTGLIISVDEYMKYPKCKKCEAYSLGVGVDGVS